MVGTKVVVSFSAQNVMTHNICLVKRVKHSSKTDVVMSGNNRTSSDKTHAMTMLLQKQEVDRENESQKADYMTLLRSILLPDSSTLEGEASTLVEHWPLLSQSDDLAAPLSPLC